MNFKSSAIAVAVAGSLVAPMAAQADVYASARIGFINNDVDGGDSELQIASLGSRFGARGETDLGNGLTGFGRYEWDVDFRDTNNTQDGPGGADTFTVATTVSLFVIVMLVLRATSVRFF